MAWERTRHGWERLSNGFDVLLEHGVPVRLSDNGRRLENPLEELADMIGAQAGLQVSIGNWEAGEADGEKEAPLRVARDQFDEVLHRLALASASLFVERFNKAIDRLDVDWDMVEYDSDFEAARRCCGLDWSDVDKPTHFERYVAVMHEETRRLTGAT